MKKLLSICLIFVFSVCLVSCSKPSDDVSSVMSSEPSEIISSQESSEDAWADVKRKANNAIDAATKEYSGAVSSSEVVYETKLHKAKAAYIWLYNNFKYRSVAVDLSSGFVDELTLELADYYFKFHRGSCEHYAAVQKVLLDQLGFETYYIEGERYDAGAGVWGEHVWIIVHYKDAYYHVDGLFGGNHTNSLTSMFFVPDTAIESTHRWDKEYYPACTQPQLLP